MHIGQPGDHLEDSALFADRDGGRAEHVLTVRNIAMHPRLGTDDDAVADLRVVLDPRLPGHDHVIAGRAASRDADLPAQEVVAADLVVMADHDQIIDLGTLTDASRLERRAIDRAVRADLDVVLDLEPAGMGDLDVPSVRLTIPKAVAAEDTA